MRSTGADFFALDFAALTGADLVAFAGAAFAALAGAALAAFAGAALAGAALAAFAGAALAAFAGAALAAFAGAAFAAFPVVVFASRDGDGLAFARAIFAGFATFDFTFTGFATAALARFALPAFAPFDELDFETGVPLVADFFAAFADQDAADDDAFFAAAFTGLVATFFFIGALAMGLALGLFAMTARVHVISASSRPGSKNSSLPRSEGEPSRAHAAAAKRPCASPEVS